MHTSFTHILSTPPSTIVRSFMVSTFAILALFVFSPSVSAGVIPNPPTNLQAVQSSDYLSIDITATPSVTSNIDYYNLYRDGVLIASGNRQPVKDRGFTFLREHTYTATAVDVYGIESPASDPATVTAVYPISTSNAYITNDVVRIIRHNTALLSLEGGVIDSRVALNEEASIMNLPPAHVRGVTYWPVQLLGGRRGFIKEAHLYLSVRPEITITNSANNPGDRIVEVDDNSNTNHVLMHAFTMESNVETLLQRISVSITSTDAGAADIEDIVLEVSLLANGSEIDVQDVDYPSGSGTTLVFSGLEYIMDANDPVEFTVNFDIDARNIGGYSEGTTLFVEVDGSTISAINGWGNVFSGVGRTTGGDVILRTWGIAAELVSVSEIVNVAHQGIFEFIYNIAAFESDVYIPETSLNAILGTPAGAVFSVNATGGTPYVSYGTVYSTADSLNDIYEIQEGATERFTVTIAVENQGTSGDMFSVRLDEIGFDDQMTLTPSEALDATLESFNSSSLYLSQQ